MYKEILNKIEILYPDYNWLNEPSQIEYIGDDGNDFDFCMDVESVLEESQYKMDESITIKKEICFESREEIFCQVYTDENNNINCIYLNID